METLIKHILSKLHHLSELKLLEVLDFVEFLDQRGEHFTTNHTEVEEDSTSFLENEEFEIIANRLADELIVCVGTNVPLLSDYAISREGIYEEHS